MKKLILFTSILMFYAVNVYAQDLNNNRLGLTITPVISKCYLFNDSFHEDVIYDGRFGYNLGFKYLRFINQNFQIETGINYSELYIYLTDAIHLTNPYQSRLEQRNMISFPLVAVKSFKRGFFISTGIQIDVELNTWTKQEVDRQDGVGFSFSLGKTFHCSENIYISVAPILKAHAIIPFYREDNHERLFDYGLKLDFTYGFLK